MRSFSGTTTGATAVRAGAVVASARVAVGIFGQVSSFEKFYA